MPNRLISIETATGQWNGSRMLYRQCEAVEIVTFPWHPLRAYQQERHRCGADASWIVTLEGELTLRTFTKHLCEAHARPYLFQIGRTDE